jgi:hypothetical protein
VGGVLWGPRGTRTANGRGVRPLGSGTRLEPSSADRPHLGWAYVVVAVWLPTPRRAHSVGCGVENGNKGAINSQGLPTRGNPFFFPLGCIWVQNPVQLRRKPHIIVTHRMCIRTQRERYVAVPQSILAHFKRRSQLIHERAVGMAKRMQPIALDPQRI